MKKISVIILFLVCSATLFAQSQQKRLEQHLYFLAADSLHGRIAGSDDAMKAAEYIIKQYEEMGVEPFYESGYIQSFTNSMIGNKMTFNNVIAWIPGSDPALKDEYVIIGAHYDHLGEKNGKVYNGADDNASGTAAVIEIARQLKEHQKELKRSVILVNFDGEELGLFGSNAFSKRLAKEKKIDKVCLMMSLDMIGWYRQSGKLIVQGTGTIEDGKKKMKELAEMLGVNLKTQKFERSVLTATDTEGFAKKGVPTLAVTTGLKSPYHKPEDDADLIDYKGLSDISDYITRWTTQVSSDELFRPSGRVAKKHQSDIQPFDLGVTVELGSSRLHFPYSSAIDGRSSFAGNVGLTAQVNFKCKWIGLKTQPMYGWSFAKYPDLSNPYSKSNTFYQEGFTLPFMVVFQTWSNHSFEIGVFHAGIGVYYTRVFKGGLRTVDPVWGYLNRNQGGFMWDIGYRFHGLDCSVYCRYQVNYITNDSSVIPHLRNFYSGVSLSYFFL